MPKIRDYFAPDTGFHPEDTAYSAFETAARRIGPEYREAGTYTADIGKIQAQETRERIWPMDIMRLVYASQKTQKTQQDSINLGRSRFGPDNGGVTPPNAFAGGGASNDMGGAPDQTNASYGATVFPVAAATAGAFGGAAAALTNNSLPDTSGDTGGDFGGGADFGGTGLVSPLSGFQD